MSPFLSKRVLAVTGTRPALGEEHLLECLTCNSRLWRVASHLEILPVGGALASGAQPDFRLGRMPLHTRHC